MVLVLGLWSWVFGSLGLSFLDFGFSSLVLGLCLWSLVFVFGPLVFVFVFVLWSLSFVLCPLVFVFVLCPLVLGLCSLYLLQLDLASTLPERQKFVHTDISGYELSGSGSESGSGFKVRARVRVRARARVRFRVRGFKVLAFCLVSYLCLVVLLSVGRSDG